MRKNVIPAHAKVVAPGLFTLCPFAFGRKAAFCLLTLLCFFTLAVSANGEELKNKRLSLTLGFTTKGVPAVEKAVWLRDGQVIFTDTLTSDSLENWVPDKFIPDSLPPIAWQLSSDNNFYRAEAFRDLRDGLRITWIVELPLMGSTFRLKVRIENAGHETFGVKWFPSWNGNWQMGNSAEWVKWWGALDFKQNQKNLSGNAEVSFGSHLHSSTDEGIGVNPFWVVGGGEQRTYFALEWCGGWEASLKGNSGTFAFNVRLPQEDTQLKLAPGEAIEGPTLWVTPTTATDEAFNRNQWMFQRRIMSRRLYEGPVPSFPLIYNNWYATFSEVDGNFLRRQVESMDDYGFDNLIVDFGWFDKAGLWQANLSKFGQGELEELLAVAQQKGTQVGLWTCPHLIDASVNHDAQMMDESGFFNRRVDAYLIDLAGSDFTTYLEDHITDLRSQFGISWWKYDQYIFSDDSENGLMKNVVAFQNALRAVRRENPTLSIENCMNGGRMINELTALSSQAIWLSDSQENGLSHARLNVETASGALEFLVPWQAYRFTNNLDQMPQNADELTRLYCRSAMIGTWGISADISKISERQKDIIVNEIALYRELNPIKLDYLYEIDSPAKGNDAAGVIFYKRSRQQAGVLLYRWDNQGDFTYRLFPKLLDPEKTYQIEDVDNATITQIKGSKLINKGIKIPFTNNRLSAVLFIKPVD
jgi:hypothetical protein